jgi:hypothetical protein
MQGLPHAGIASCRDWCCNLTHPRTHTRIRAERSRAHARTHARTHAAINSFTCGVRSLACTCSAPCVTRWLRSDDADPNPRYPSLTETHDPMVTAKLARVTFAAHGCKDAADPACNPMTAPGPVWAACVVLFSSRLLVLVVLLSSFCFPLVCWFLLYSCLRCGSRRC